MLRPTNRNANDPYELLIAQIVRAERQPQARLKEQQSKGKVQRAVLNDFTTALSGLRTELQKLTDQFANPFGARTTGLSANAPFSATASPKAATGAHTLAVERLASADTRVSQRLDAEGSGLRSFFDAEGPQTFAVDVGSPTSGEPGRRVRIEVSVAPSGTTDGEVLGEVRKAMADAFAQAAADGRISRADVPQASVVNETTGSARLSLRAGGTGFERRLGFEDSAGGLLARLQLNRTEPAGTASSTTTPATGAQVGGEPIGGPVSITLLNRGLNVTIGGAARSVNLATGTYSTPEALAAAVGAALGSDVRVEAVDGALQVTTTATGQASTLQFTGGSALADLRLPTTLARGTDAKTETVLAGQSGGAVFAVGTSEEDSALSSRFVLDGLTFYRGTNEVRDALPGVTLSLRAAGPAETLTVSPDTGVAKEQVEAFMTKYNAVMDFIAKKSAIDVEARTRGDFAGDSAIQSLRAGVRADLLRAVPGQGELARDLRALGIETQKDGTLKLTDSARLAEAVAADPAAVQRLFSAEDDGLAVRLRTRLDTFLGAGTAPGGLLKIRKDAMDADLRRLDKRVKDWDGRMESREKQLRAQFARLQETVTLVQGQQQQLMPFLFY